MESKLKELRTQRHMSQQELADASGVSRATIANIELGTQKNIMTGTLIKLADALGVPARELV
ncbi:MAG: helix-turn-helix transcriptional regulator [Oribacterium sp.]|nr:helix-turn-helix transcriptional regulator [Oribacterium sp.]